MTQGLSCANSSTAISWIISIQQSWPFLLFLMNSAANSFPATLFMHFLTTANFSPESSSPKRSKSAQGWSRVTARDRSPRRGRCTRGWRRGWGGWRRWRGPPGWPWSPVRSATASHPSPRFRVHGGQLRGEVTTLPTPVPPPPGREPASPHPLCRGHTRS